MAGGCKWCSMGQCWTHVGKGKGNGKGGGGGARASWMSGGTDSASGEDMMEMVMQMMSQQGWSAPGGKRKAGGGEEPPAKKRKITVTDDDLLWKQRLSMAHAKKQAPEPIPKGAFEYVTENDGDSWVSMLSCEKFDSNYPGTGSSKKAAEEDAAKSAFEGEFPEIWEKLSNKVQEEGPQVLKLVHQARQPAQEESVKMKKSLLREDLQWRTRLATALGQHLGAVAGPEALTYTNVKLEGNTGFRCTLSSEHFDKEYEGGKCASKKLAEESVAKNAFQNEFGALFAQLPETVQQQKAGKVGGNKAIQAAADAAKEASATTEQHPKGVLTQALCLKLGRSLTKEDISYSFKEQGDTLVPILTINCLDKKGIFEGEPIEAGSSKADKKKAEGAVATKALVAYKKLFAGNSAKQEANAAKKKELWDARRKDMQAKTAAEKEAKKAAKEAEA